MKRTVSIRGMTCGHCSRRVTEALESTDGVNSAVVSHEHGTAILDLAKDVDFILLKDAVRDAGYTLED